jgi:hypothetical protein
MKKSTRFRLLLSIISILTLLQSCKDDSYLLTPPPVPDQSFVEEFDTAQKAYDRGWRFINRSDLIGRRGWGNPVPDANITIPFQAYSGPNAAAYLWANYESTSSGPGTISNWAVSPELIMQNGDKIVFYTRCEIVQYQATPSSPVITTDFVNRMQVRINKSNSLNCGDGTDPGDFTTPILDINPFYNEFVLEYFNDPLNPRYNEARQAYPHVWTRFEATVVGLNEPTKGRFALRYFTEEAGLPGRATSIGVDSLAYISVKH